MFILLISKKGKMRSIFFTLALHKFSSYISVSSCLIIFYHLNNGLSIICKDKFG